MAKQKKTKAETQKERLEKELSALLPEIGEEGLVFLLKQANTIIHNQRAVQLNREIDELNRNKESSGNSRSAEPEADSGKKGGFKIEINRSQSGKNYHFTVNGRKHFFDIAETRKIVELCYRPETKSAALKYLHQFFSTERDEILMEHGIESAKSPFFEELFYAVRSSFTLE